MSRLCWPRSRCRCEITRYLLIVEARVERDVPARLTKRGQGGSVGSSVFEFRRVEAILPTLSNAPSILRDLYCPDAAGEMPLLLFRDSSEVIGALSK